MPINDDKTENKIRQRNFSKVNKREKMLRMSKEIFEVYYFHSYNQKILRKNVLGEESIY